MCVNRILLALAHNIYIHIDGDVDDVIYTFISVLPSVRFNYNHYYYFR